MTNVRLCRNCKYSLPEAGSPWSLECTKPEVMVSDVWLLANNSRHGASCIGERNKGWFAACGRKGKLWEAKYTVEEVTL